MRDAEMLVWAGDFNYRVEATYEDALEHIRNNDLDYLIERVCTASLLAAMSQYWTFVNLADGGSGGLAVRDACTAPPRSLLQTVEACKRSELLCRKAAKGPRGAGGAEGNVRLCSAVHYRCRHSHSCLELVLSQRGMETFAQVQLPA